MFFLFHFYSSLFLKDNYSFYFLVYAQLKGIRYSQLCFYIAFIRCLFVQAIIKSNCCLVILQWTDGNIPVLLHLPEGDAFYGSGVWLVQKWEGLYTRLVNDAHSDWY
ncbi:hypothetical protein GDO86_002888 [Hymenochirus boettgeri]|uniref:Uncharacterized protein n=1 Tax=Hymenochirus boettgeri TaxID=247094 RepID=A0A8T2K456_9PIPI|nr:hypothetical protein GDO86_002888 [Hymenochirus boettgeri]